MKINFAQLEVYTDIEKTDNICSDARQQLGELIYETEYTEEEIQTLMQFVNQYCKPAIIDAINALKTE